MYLWQTMTQRFRPYQKLKQKKHIALLFSEGKRISAYPLCVVYKPMVFKDGVSAKVGVSVAKKTFKKAVTRNYIKRLMREAYRQNRNTYLNTNTSYALMFLYIGKKKPTFKVINKAMITLLQKISHHDEHYI